MAHIVKKADGRVPVLLANPVDNCMVSAPHEAADAQFGKIRPVVALSHCSLEVLDSDMGTGQSVYWIQRQRLQSELLDTIPVIDSNGEKCPGSVTSDVLLARANIGLFVIDFAAHRSGSLRNYLLTVDSAIEMLPSEINEATEIGHMPQMSNFNTGTFAVGRSPRP